VSENEQSITNYKNKNFMENQELIQQVTEKASKWLTPAYDAEAQAEVKRMLDSEDKTELIESFYRDLEFGTGGLRGIMGVGSNRMNIYTVGAATQGLSNYLNNSFKELKQISVVIGHDCRNNSRKFAEISANIFSANGIKVYLFEALRPTPEISFAIRRFGCQSGIILTASHNPKEYNGYKAYWDDGAQVLAPHDTGIIGEVEKIASAADIKFVGNPELIEIIGEAVDSAFIEQVKTVSIDPEVIKRHHDMKIVYTPIHGTGVTLIPRALKSWGFTNIIDVPEQNVISGDFPTVKSPNPEEPAALSMAIERAKAMDAELVMASDPDADRVGISCKNDKGEWVLINGNQTCLMYLYYILTQYSALGKIKGNEYCVKTIVTTELIKKIADKNNIEMLDCYTGFKWIAREIRLNEGVKKYIGGGEESYGFLAEDFVRDKDAVSACCLIAEIAAWAKDNGKTLYQLLQDIYVEYGFSKEKGISVVKKGKSGAEEIKQMMTDFRNNPPKEMAGSKIILWKDYQTLKQTDAAGNVTDLDMPDTSNVLQYFTEDGSKVSVRPSGTEPKIKFYVEVKGEMGCRNCYAGADAAADEKIQAVMKSLGI
jgi:phosphoglucomutase